VRPIASYRSCAKLGASSVARGGMREQSPNRHGADADLGFILEERIERGGVPGTLLGEALGLALSLAVGEIQYAPNRERPPSIGDNEKPSPRFRVTPWTSAK
jgi:hypothetical protein